MAIWVNLYILTIQMSNVNINQPLQLIRYKDGKFEVPPETGQFLKQFKNPLGVISIVGKYRTGKSLFLNKVLLKKSTFKVSPTINSCTKGLWMCRQTLKSQQVGQETDVLVLDSEGFGAPEQTDKYNHKILLFAMLLSSYFIYNSVGSIDQNAINSLNVVSQLARQILNNNSKGQKVHDESPFFLWLLRDFALNLIDKKGENIQAKDYLEQSLENQKGSSDAIENKNKIRRMLKHFFKERDCFTLVRPVQSEDDLQNLVHLPEGCLRPEFMEQVTKLRHKILTKVKSKRIKGKPLDGQSLLQLANNYVEVVNRGDLPSYELSYKHIMKFQIQRNFGQFIDKCQNIIEDKGEKMMPKEEIDEMEKLFLVNLETKFKGDTWDAEEIKNVVEKGKKYIEKAIGKLRKQNYGKCIENCENTWKKISGSEQQYQNEEEISMHFAELFEKLKIEMKRKENPVEQSFMEATVFKQQILVLSKFLNTFKSQTSKKIQIKDQEIYQLQLTSTELKSKIKDLQDKNNHLSKQLHRNKIKLTETQELKTMEIQHLKQKEVRNTVQIKELMQKYTQTNEQLDQCRNSLIDQQTKNQQLSRNYSQISEDKRLNDKQLEIIRHNLQSKSQEVIELRSELADTAARLQAALEKQSFILSKHQSEMEHKAQAYHQVSRKNQVNLESINQLNLKVQELQKDLENNTTIMEREKSIYENMFDSLKESLKLEANSRQELIEANKNLSAALKHLEKRTEQAEEKEKQLKDYKKCVKNSSCLQCQHCTKFFVPSIFLPHLNVCLIGPEALKSTRPNMKGNSKSKLQIKVRQTLVRQSAEGKPFTEYVLQFRRDHKEWSVTRKYKTFCDLHSALKGALPGVQLSEVSYVVNPQQASKKSLVIDQRRKTLQKYLNDLESNPFVSVTPMWADFIEEPDSISSSARNSPLKQSSRPNQQQTPEQFFKIWNERQMRGKESQSIKGKWKM